MPAEAHPQLLRESAAVGVLLLLVGLFNPGPALFGRVLGGYDAFVYFYPLRSYIAETVGQGRLPLWNPYLFAGSPYLANPQTAVFYPGTWLFVLLDVPYAYALNFLGHLWIASVALYAFGRVSLGLSRVACVIGGAAFAFSGFMNGQAGHINQFSVAAWLPAVALALDLTMRTGRPLAAAGLVLGLTLQILAGHPQQVYMTVVALGLFVLWRSLGMTMRPGWPRSQVVRSRVAILVRGGVALGVAAGLAGAISAVQLLPTLELSRLSIRGGGLSYQIAAFDGLPWPLMLPALFPGYWMHLPTTEFFGHLGTVLFVVAWIGLLVGAGRAAALGAAYVALGLLLAVGDATSVYRLLFDWAPGFSSFRVPARWLLVSTFGLSILAAVGADWLMRQVSSTHGTVVSRLRDVARRISIVRGVLVGGVIPLALASLVVFGQPQSKWLLLVWSVLTGATVLLALLVVAVPRARTVALSALLLGSLADLWLAGQNLEHRHPVPNVAFNQPREATTELQARMAEFPGYRSLSVATPEYIVKETGEYEERFGGAPRLMLENLLVTVKWNDTLWPNVPLVHRIPSADGYDGGVLPLRTYYQLAQAMLGTTQARPDGVLASRLDTMPEPRWLDLLGVRWVLASRVKDDSQGAIYYDRGVSVTLQPGQRLTLDTLPLGEFTKLGFVSSLGPPAEAPDAASFRSLGPVAPGAVSEGDAVGVVRLSGTAGGQRVTTAVPIVVGEGTAPEAWPAEQAPALERVTAWSARGPDAPGDWIAEIPFARQPVSTLEIVNTSPSAVLHVRALNLIDDDRQMAFPITPDSRVERIDYFDLKLYDRQDALPRAYVVGRSQALGDAAMSARLADPEFDPRTEVVLAGGETARELNGSSSGSSASFEIDTAEFVRLRVQAASDGYLVLSDSWFPGWVATVDGSDVPIERANILFRAVVVPPGVHVVEFRYEPQSVRTGALISAGGVVGFVVLFGAALVWSRRRRASEGKA